MLATMVLRHSIVAMFSAETSPAHAIAAKGHPFFAIGFVPFAVNMMAIGYRQSVERLVLATSLTLLRGFVFMILCFVVLPPLTGSVGAWLAVPVSELLTLSVLLFSYFRNREAITRLLATCSKLKPETTVL